MKSRASFFPSMIALLALAVGATLWWTLRPSRVTPPPEVEESENLPSPDPLWPAVESDAPAFQPEPVHETDVVAEEPPVKMPVPSVKMGEEHWAGGMLKARGPLKQRADGQWVKDGIWTNYWANGRINTFGQYEADEPVGTWPFWMDQGQPLLPNQYRPPTLAQQPVPVPGPPVKESAAADDRPALRSPQRTSTIAETSADKSAGSGAESVMVAPASNDHRPPAITQPPTPAPTVSQPSVRPPATQPPVPLRAVEPSSGCVATRLDSLDWNPSAVAKTLEVLFPELLFQYDAKAGMLKSTGCDKQLKLIEPLLAVARGGSAELWRMAVEQHLWNAGSQLGLLRHSIYGFELKKPTGGWTLAGVTPDAGWSQRLGGKAVYGVSLVQKKTRMQFLVADLKGARTAHEIGEKDAKLPPGAWPQAVAEAQWKHAVAAETAAPLGGVRARQKSNYHSRQMYDIGKEKMVGERFYLAQPSADGESTRIYFFLTLIPEADYFNQARWLETFVTGLTMPEMPTQAVLSAAPGVLAAAPAAGSTAASAPKYQPAPYTWQLTANRSPEVRAALKAKGPTDHAQCEALWIRALPSLSQSEIPEGLWFLACAQLNRRNYAQAASTFRQLHEQFSHHRLGFNAALMQGTVEGFHRQNWNRAEAAWQRAAKLAVDPSQKWRAACKLAVVPFYKKQYRQAVESLEALLKQFPDDETADLTRWYFWYLKTCLEKKI